MTVSSSLKKLASDGPKFILFGSLHKNTQELNIRGYGNNAAAHFFR
jgi:hypothetical protein